MEKLWVWSTMIFLEKKLGERGRMILNQNNLKFLDIVSDKSGPSSVDPFLQHWPMQQKTPI